jgi:hypothetical protein
LIGFALQTTLSRLKQKGILPDRLLLVKRIRRIPENYFQERNSRSLANQTSIQQEKRLHRICLCVALNVNRLMSGKEAL